MEKRPLEKRPSTIVMSVRCDLRDITVIALWLNEQRRLPDTIGTLARTSIELFSDMIRSKEPKYSKMTTSEAITLLNQMGLRRGERNRETLIKRLELEDAVLELKEPSKPIISSDELDRIMEDVTKSSNYSKEEMDRLTNQLGDIVDDTDQRPNHQERELPPIGEGTKSNKED